MDAIFSPGDLSHSLIFTYIICVIISRRHCYRFLFSKNRWRCLGKKMAETTLCKVKHIFYTLCFSLLPASYNCKMFIWWAHTWSPILMQFLWPEKPWLCMVPFFLLTRIISNPKNCAKGGLPVFVILLEGCWVKNY